MAEGIGVGHLTDTHLIVMTNKTPPIAVSRRPVARDKREETMIAEDFDDKGLFRGGKSGLVMMNFGVNS